MSKRKSRQNRINRHKNKAKKAKRSDLLKTESGTNLPLLSEVEVSNRGVEYVISNHMTFSPRDVDGRNTTIEKDNNFINGSPLSTTGSFESSYISGSEIEESEYDSNLPLSTERKWTLSPICIGTSTDTEQGAPNYIVTPAIDEVPHQPTLLPNDSVNGDGDGNYHTIDEGITGGSFVNSEEYESTLVEVNQGRSTDDECNEWDHLEPLFICSDEEEEHPQKECMEHKVSLAGENVAEETFAKLITVEEATNEDANIVEEIVTDDEYDESEVDRAVDIALELMLSLNTECIGTSTDTEQGAPNYIVTPAIDEVPHQPTLLPNDSVNGDGDVENSLNALDSEDDASMDLHEELNKNYSIELGADSEVVETTGCMGDIEGSYIISIDGGESVNNHIEESLVVEGIEPITGYSSPVKRLCMDFKDTINYMKNLIWPCYDGSHIQVMPFKSCLPYILLFAIYVYITRLLGIYEVWRNNGGNTALLLERAKLETLWDCVNMSFMPIILVVAINLRLHGIRWLYRTTAFLTVLLTPIIPLLIFTYFFDIIRAKMSTRTMFALLLVGTGLFEFARVDDMNFLNVLKAMHDVMLMFFSCSLNFYRDGIARVLMLIGDDATNSVHCEKSEMETPGNVSTEGEDMATLEIDATEEVIEPTPSSDQFVQRSIEDKPVPSISNNPCTNDAIEVVVYVHAAPLSSEAMMERMFGVFQLGNYPRNIMPFPFSWFDPGCTGRETHEEREQYIEDSKICLQNVMESLLSSGITDVHFVVDPSGSELFLKVFEGLNGRDNNCLFRCIQTAEEPSPEKVNVLSITLLFPPQKKDYFIEKCYGAMRKYCDLITIFGRRRPEASWNEIVYGTKYNIEDAITGLWVDPIHRRRPSGVFLHVKENETQSPLDINKPLNWLSPSEERCLQEIARYSSKMWLDVDCIDVSWLPHHWTLVYEYPWNFSAEICEDLREIMVNRKRAKDRVPLLEQTAVNAWAYRSMIS